MNILIAEDDPNILNGLVDIFQNEGYKTIKAKNGKEALQLYLKHKPDFICLDIMMPDISGYDICRKIRNDNPDVPVIFISAKSEEIDKVLGLELGADDYIVKPFGVREVVARIRAITRRALAKTRKANAPDYFVMRDVQVFPDQLRAKRRDTVIDLSLRDIDILAVLFENKNRPVTRYELFNQAWGLDHIPNSRTLDQHISQLRKKIELDPKEPQIIETVQGIGYRYNEK
jgi:two-component system, OmpR family, alkaline phosphatase synthesis response regulator PhoP